MRIFPMLLLAATTLPAQTFPGLQSQPEYQIHRDPVRDSWQKPDQVISSLNFSTSETVAVIENGFPYFAQRIAPFVKKVYAVNSDPRAFQGRGALPPAITTIVSTNDDPNISGLNVDTVIMIDVLRQVTERLPYYQKLATGLKAGSRLVIIDRNRASVVPQSQRMTDSLIEAELPQLGMSLGQKFTFLPTQYFLVFKY
jgi:hypothetical protein